MPKPKNELWQHCKRFVEKHQISCSETIYQTDRVIENAYDFIDGICEIVGFCSTDEDDEDEAPTHDQ